MKPDAAGLTAIDDQGKWDEFVLRENGHLLQSHAWGQLKSCFGWRAERLAWKEGGRISAGAQVLMRRLLPGLEVAYVPRGPVASNVDFLRALRGSMQSRGVFLLKLEPNWQRGDHRDALLAAAGLKHSNETIQPSSTIRIDLTLTLEEILATMKAKWRYNIRLSEKKGSKVRGGTSGDLPAFFELTRLTAERDKFGVHPTAYYRMAFELLAAENAARLFIAEFEGEPIAMIFVTAFGSEAIYLYGASGNQHRNVMPNHGLHWAAIQWAKSRGCKWYDMWGIPEATEGRTDEVGRAREEASPLPDSLYQFKRGFGGEVFHYTGAWDAVYSEPSYRVYGLARRLRRRGIGA